jgi:sarcosine oxidase delta subunit
VRESGGATARAVCRTFGIRSHRCLHADWCGRSKEQIFEHREAAAGVYGMPRTVWGSSRERWRDGAGCLPDLTISAPSVVARILVWARDATDFRPSINGAGGACASRRSLWESSRERWRDGAGCYRTLGFRPPRCLHARILVWARDATDFRPSMNGVSRACASRRTICKSSRERWRDGAGCYRTLGFRPPRSLQAY